MYPPSIGILRKASARLELESKLAKSSKFKHWVNEYMYLVLRMIQAGEEHALIRESGMGELIDNETLRNAAITVLTLQLEYEDARANKFEGMSRDAVSKLHDAIRAAADNYEFLRRLVNADDEELIIKAG